MLPIPLPRGQRCVTWSYKLVSKSQPGMFSVDHSGGEGWGAGGGGGSPGALAGRPDEAVPPEPGADPEEIQVTDTDYGSFALLLSRRQSDLQSILRVSLLCEPLTPARPVGGVGGGEASLRAPRPARAEARPCSLAPRQNMGHSDPAARQVHLPGPSSGPLR